MDNSFLKKIGTILSAGSGLAPLIPIVGPLISALIPKTAPAIQNINDELPAIAGIIIQIEAIGQAMSLPGTKKLEIAAPLVAQIVLASPLMAGKKIKDQAMFMKGITSMSGGMADILNSLHEDSVKVIDLTKESTDQGS